MVMKEGLDILLPKVYIELFCVASCIYIVSSLY